VPVNFVVQTLDEVGQVVYTQSECVEFRSQLGSPPDNGSELGEERNYTSANA